MDSKKQQKPKQESHEQQTQPPEMQMFYNRNPNANSSQTNVPFFPSWLHHQPLVTRQFMPLGGPSLVLGYGRSGGDGVTVNSSEPPVKRGRGSTPGLAKSGGDSSGGANMYTPLPSAFNLNVGGRSGGDSSNGANASEPSLQRSGGSTPGLARSGGDSSGGPNRNYSEPPAHQSSGGSTLGLGRSGGDSSGGANENSLEPLVKRGRGRPRGGKNKPRQKPNQRRRLEEGVTNGPWFMPHVITVQTGEDILLKILEFKQQAGTRSICILSATGSVSSTRLHDGSVTHEGPFEIVSLTGSFTNSEIDDDTDSLSVSLARPDGQVIGGRVADMLIAGSKVKVVVGSYILVEEDKKQNQSVSPAHEPETAPDGSQGQDQSSKSASNTGSSGRDNNNGSSTKSNNGSSGKTKNHGLFGNLYAT